MAPRPIDLSSDLSTAASSGQQIRFQDEFLEHSFYTMARWGGCAFTWAALAMLLAFASVGESGLLSRDKTPPEIEELELHLGEPQKAVDTNGGTMEVWENLQALKDANVGVAKLTLRERGLLLPMYSDSPTLAYVEEGEGIAGLLTGLHGESASTRRVRRGDVVAIPRGIPQWFYNDGKQDLRVLYVAQTNGGTIPGLFTVFKIVGQKSGEVGGIVHGFSKHFLSEAWDIEEKEVEQVVNSQKGSGIVKLSKAIEVKNIGERKNNEAHDESSQFQEFVYNVLEEKAAGIRVENAGRVSGVNKFKLPILKALQLGLSYVRLEEKAVFLPSWSPTGHLIVHFLKGSGRVEIANNKGDQLISKQVKAGDIYVVPRFFPSGAQAGDEGLEWVAISTSDLPFAQAIGGKTSVFRSLPVEVAAAVLDIDIELEKKIREKQPSAFIAPPRGKSAGHSSHEEF